MKYERILLTVLIIVLTIIAIELAKFYIALTFLDNITQGARESLNTYSQYIEETYNAD